MNTRNSETRIWSILFTAILQLGKIFFLKKLLFTVIFRRFLESGKLGESFTSSVEKCKKMMSKKLVKIEDLKKEMNSKNLILSPDSPKVKDMPETGSKLFCSNLKIPIFFDSEKRQKIVRNQPTFSPDRRCLPDNRSKSRDRRRRRKRLPFDFSFCRIRTGSNSD